MVWLVSAGWLQFFGFFFFSDSDQLRGSLTAQWKKPQQDMFGRQRPDCSIKEPITSGNGEAGGVWGGPPAPEHYSRSWNGRRVEEKTASGRVTVGEELKCERRGRMSSAVMYCGRGRHTKWAGSARTRRPGHGASSVWFPGLRSLPTPGNISTPR